MRHSQILGAALCLFATALVCGQAPRTPARPKPAGITEQELQYDGRGPFQLFDRPSKNQGLDTLLARGRVAPEDILVDPKNHIRDSARTIFHDQYTGGEVWRITDYPSGLVRHTYSGVPAWNANGRYILLEHQFNGTLLFDQEKCTQSNVPFGGEWSPTEPNLIFNTGKWENVEAVLAYDIVQRKPLRALAPVRTYAGIAPVSPDGKWVCWREGTQDDATSFGLAAADGSSYKSIATTGGIIAEQTPVTLKPLPPQPTLATARAGIHQMYFSKRPDHSVLINVHGDKPNGRLFDTDGKLIAGMENLTHQAWSPDGSYVLFMKAGAVAMDPIAQKPWNILDVAKAIEGHTTWNSFDPNWAGMSWRTNFAGEILRVSMRDDHSVARLCGSCPLNPDTTAYNNDEFACNSPDGTKVLFMSTMSGNVNEYIVVAANPRAPALAGEWKGDAFQLTITPDNLNREAKTYRIYRTGKTGQDYRQIGSVDVPENAPVGTQAPLTFTVKDLAKNQSAFFAVRTQEWSGLTSRYSNEVSSDNKPTARYLEPETLAFSGYMQGFDPQGAADMYYLFVPEEGRDCSVSIDVLQTDSQVFARVAGKNVAFAAGGKTIAQNSYPDWTWVSLGSVTGPMKITSKSAGFKLDRIFITPDKSQTPQGKGLDYAPNAAFAAQTPEILEAKPRSPFVNEITWKPVANARSYNLYAGDKPDFVPAQSNLLYSPPVGAERVLDWGLKPGSTTFYKVVAIDCDDTASKASNTANARTPALTPQTVEISCASSPGAQTEDDKAAANGKAVLLDKAHEWQATFAVPADGDYVFWHDFRADNGNGIRMTVKIDDNKYTMEDTYDLTRLGGGTSRKEWVWSRFTFLWSKDNNGILHLNAGQHTLNLTTTSPIHLDKIIITNDQSFVPKGHLCTF